MPKLSLPKVVYLPTLHSFKHIELCATKLPLKFSRILYCFGVCIALHETKLMPTPSLALSFEVYILVNTTNDEVSDVFVLC